MKISIAMATYNGEKYLREQLDSFSGQTRLPDELVVCDDGSSDDTLSILENYAAVAPFPMRIISNDKNLGYGGNFQKAIANCVGQIVFLSDQDDYWLANKIAVQVRYIEQNPDCMVSICDMEVCDADLTPSGGTKLQSLVAMGYNERHFVNGCGMAIRKQFLDIAFPMSDASHAHDSWLSALADTLQVKHVIRQPLQLHRRHGANASRNIAVRSTKVGPLDRIAMETSRSSRGGWEQELADINLVLARLKGDGFGLADDWVNKLPLPPIDSLERKASALTYRISVTSHHRATRWPLVVWSWLAGNYRSFNGWKSAVKDLVSP